MSSRETNEIVIVKKIKLNKFKRNNLNYVLKIYIYIYCNIIIKEYFTFLRTYLVIKLDF